MTKKQPPTPRAEFYFDERCQMYRKRKTLNGEMFTVYGKTKAEARKKMQDIEAQVEAGILVNDKTTFGEYAARWIPLVTADLSYSGARVYDNAINTWLLPIFMARPLRDIKPLEIDELLKSMAGKSHSTQKKVLFVFRKLMNSAMENGLILKNPTAGKTAGGRTTSEKKPLTDAQSEALLQAVSGTRALPFVALGLYAGLRREEILGLHWADVHLDDTHPWLSVCHAVRFEHDTPILSDELKSDAAARNIPLPTPLQNILREERSLIAAAKRPASVLVVPSSAGTVCTASSFRRLWGLVESRQKASPDDQTPKNTPKIHCCQRVLDFEVTPHILRHTYITRLCTSGLDIKKIQYLAGHSDPAITLRIYSHVVGNRPEDLYSKIDDAFKKRSGDFSGDKPSESSNSTSKQA